MEYKTEFILLEKNFPFAFYNGKGFSRDDRENGTMFMHNHYCLEINYAVASGGTYLIGDSSYPIEKDDIFIINNYEYHAALSTSQEMELKIIVFDPDLIWQNEQMDYQYIKAFYEWSDHFKHRLTRDNQISENIGQIIFDIEQEWNEQATGYRLVIKALLLKMLAILYRSFETTSQYSEKVLQFQNEYIRIIEAINHIDNHFTESITLQELADKVHMNPNYFSTFFSNVMNTPVSAYIIKRRLRYACLKLTTSEDSIISIAMESGFNNVSYFNRTFRKHFGMTPQQYRRQMN
ncbi:AraC family transcriptional regulator [Paenibacillus sp. LS1]|uniref:helix-turn-helix transcriptional regulator n=1 Tax=Paenibacillus sp. LS1 TaxID=2992120 RepID=UPI002232CB31|nr:AraC family transcriptional regulator [Paenibacillus sp. LS1]MCW3790244.1 AraC family transcriptional regulator [Paenibacillus sp. LS1]